MRATQERSSRPCLCRGENARIGDDLAAMRGGDVARAVSFREILGPRRFRFAHAQRLSVRSTTAAAASPAKWAA